MSAVTEAFAILDVVTEPGTNLFSRMAESAIWSLPTVPSIMLLDKMELSAILEPVRAPAWIFCEVMRPLAKRLAVMALVAILVPIREFGVSAAAGIDPAKSPPTKVADAQLKGPMAPSARRLKSTAFAITFEALTENDAIADSVMALAAIIPLLTDSAWKSTEEIDPSIILLLVREPTTILFPETAPSAISFVPTAPTLILLFVIERSANLAVERGGIIAFVIGEGIHPKIDEYATEVEAALVSTTLH